MEPLLEAWRKNCAINLYLLEQVNEKHFDLSLPKSKPIRAQFAHIVNVRRMKLKMAARDLLDTDEKTNRHHAGREDLRSDLISSGEAVERMLSLAADPSAKLKGVPGSITTNLAVLLVHEGNHRGQIEAALRAAGAELPVDVQIRMWDWSKF